MGDIISYRDLIVWQKGMDLVETIYRVTTTFPSQEMYGLVAQMRRAAVSIPANTAEGHRRGSRKDYRQFVIIAFGSESELETHLEISMRLKYLTRESFETTYGLLQEIMRMLNKLTTSLQPTP
jgi:four helix bundle protein